MASGLKYAADGGEVTSALVAIALRFDTAPALQFVNECGMSGFLKITERLSLPGENEFVFLIGVIGGSEISKGGSTADLDHPSWLGRGSRWGAALFLLAVALFFGGAAGPWFDAGLAGGGSAFRFLQLATGSMAMGGVVAVPGSLLFGRNPVRWGMGMPILAYSGGVALALLAGHPGVLGLIYGAPLFLGLAIATGVMGAFLIDGVLPALKKA